MKKTKNAEVMVKDQILTSGHESKNTTNYVEFAQGKLSTDLLREYLLQASIFLQEHQDEQAENEGLMVKARRLHDKLLSNGGKVLQENNGTVRIAGERISPKQMERVLFFAAWNLLEKKSIALHLVAWWISLQILEPEENTPWDFALLAEDWLEIPHLHILNVLEMFDAIAE